MYSAALRYFASFEYFCTDVAVFLYKSKYGERSKKNLNASRPSEHPPVRGKMSKRLGGIIGCKCKTSSWDLNGFLKKNQNASRPSEQMVVTLGQQYDTGEKPTAMLYTYYINRYAGTPDKKTKQKHF